MSQPKLINNQSWWATISAVLWAFLGVRRKSDFEDDIGKLTPLQIAIVGAIGGVLFVVLLMLVVQWVVASA
jgi:hypothetical protein